MKKSEDIQESIVIPEWSFLRTIKNNSFVTNKKCLIAM